MTDIGRGSVDSIFLYKKRDLLTEGSFFREVFVFFHTLVAHNFL